MEKTINETMRNKWLSVPIIATITRFLCRELALQNDYLRKENKILRSNIKKRISFADDERQTLANAALVLGRDLMKQVVSIVKPETIFVWQRTLEKQKWDYTERRRKKAARPRISSNIERLVCKMARENIWGYNRIQGELKKLGIELSKTTVANMLRRNNLPPSPERKGLTWREFLSRHKEVFLCADFFTKEVWTFKGLCRVYVFFVIHLQTRKVLFSRATFSPNSQWLKQQIRHVLWECEDQNVIPRFFLHDNDKCFSVDFDSMLNVFGVKAMRTPIKAPNANAHAERYVRSIKKERLDHLLIFGSDRFQHVIDCYISYFNEHRPHQGIDNKIPAEYNIAGKWQGGNMLSNITIRNIARKDFLGGLLKSYRRAA